MSASTLDLLLADEDDVEEQNAAPPRRRVVGPATWGAHRSSVGFSLASMKSRDVALKDIRLAALFAGEETARVSFDARTVAPAGRRHHSLPVSLFSDTDGPDESGSRSPRPKRASLLDMIDADHPLSPSRDLAAEPESPTAKRTKRLSGPITRPSLIEQQTARLAKEAAALAAHSDDDDATGYASETETVADQHASPPLPRHEHFEAGSYAQPFAIPFEAPAEIVLGMQSMPSMYEQQQYEQQMMMAQQQYEQQQYEQQQYEQQQYEQQAMMAQQQYEQQLYEQQQQYEQAQYEQQAMMAQQQYQMALAQQQYQLQQMQMMRMQMQMVAPPPRAVQPQTLPPAKSAVSPPPPDRRRPPAKPASGQLLQQATDRHGSRTLQDALPRMSDTQLARAVDELGPHLLVLAKHPAANYVVSTLASLPLAHAALVGALRGRVVELLVHPQGSRVVQAAISELPDAAAHALVAELQGPLLGAALDTHGSWGVCAAYKRTHAPFILAGVMALLPQLAVQQHGCRVVQRVLSEAASAGADIGPAAHALVRSDVARLAVDAYANYAIQVTLRHCHDDERSLMVEALLPKLLQLSTSKHGSNVAEAVLSQAAPQVLLRAHRTIFADRATLCELMAHPYGNYVLQALLRRLSSDDRAAALRTIEQNSADGNFGKAIAAHFGAAV